MREVRSEDSSRHSTATCLIAHMVGRSYSISSRVSAAALAILGPEGRIHKIHLEVSDPFAYDGMGAEDNRDQMKCR